MNIEEEEDDYRKRPVPTMALRLIRGKQVAGPIDGEYVMGSPTSATGRRPFRRKSATTHDNNNVV